MIFGEKKKNKMLDSVDLDAGIELLQAQIGAAKRLLDNRPVKPEDHETWIIRTSECLTGMYGAGSPNVDTIVRAAGPAPTWLFMPEDADQRYYEARLEDQMHKLEQCVVALKRKAEEVQGA